MWILGLAVSATDEYGLGVDEDIDKAFLSQFDLGAGTAGTLEGQDAQPRKPQEDAMEVDLLANEELDLSEDNEKAQAEEESGCGSSFFILRIKNEPSLKAAAVQTYTIKQVKMEKVTKIEVDKELVNGWVSLSTATAAPTEGVEKPKAGKEIKAEKKPAKSPPKKKAAAGAKKKRASEPAVRGGGKVKRRVVNPPTSTVVSNSSSQPGATGSGSDGGRRVSARQTQAKATATPAQEKKGSRGKGKGGSAEEGTDPAMMHLLDKPSRGWCYVYRGELHRKASQQSSTADMAKVLGDATLRLYAAAFPHEPRPTALPLSEAPVRGKLAQLLSRLCADQGIKNLDTEALEKRLRDPKCPLWHQRDFLRFNVTLSSAKLISVDNGLLALLTKALGLDSYASLHSKEAVMYWYKHCPRDRRRGGR